MTAVERRFLEECSVRIRRNRRKVLAGAGVFGIGLPASGYLLGALVSRGMVCWMVGLSVGLVFGALIFGLVQTASGRIVLPTVEGIRRDIAEDAVDAREFKASEAVSVTGLAAPGYFLAVPGGILYLQGAYLKEAVEAKKFPCDCFVVRRGRHSGIALGIECMGASLVPTAERDPRTPNLFAAEDGMVMEGSLSALDGALAWLRASNAGPDRARV